MSAKLADVVAVTVETICRTVRSRPHGAREPPPIRHRRSVEVIPHHVDDHRVLGCLSRFTRSSSGSVPAGRVPLFIGLEVSEPSRSLMRKSSGEAEQTVEQSLVLAHLGLGHFAKRPGSPANRGAVHLVGVARLDEPMNRANTFFEIGSK